MWCCARRCVGRAPQGRHGAVLRRGWLDRAGGIDGPGSAAGLLARYFERMRAIVEAHEAQATVHALRGEPVEAERLAREAISLIGGSDDAIFQPDAWFTLGEILALARKTDEAETALEEALGRYEQKGQPRDGRPHSTTAGRAPGGGATMSVPIVPCALGKLAIVIEAIFWSNDRPVPDPRRPLSSPPSHPVAPCSGGDPGSGSV